MKCGIYLEDENGVPTKQWEGEHDSVEFVEALNEHKGLQVWIGYYHPATSETPAMAKFEPFTVL